VRAAHARPHIDSSEVTVELTGGKVVLAGTIPHRGMKRAIEDMAEACLGVAEVENRIRVIPPASPPG
jgi:osmotically-inducible protein OsmY